MSLTGVLLMYERQLIERSDRGFAAGCPLTVRACRLRRCWFDWRSSGPIRRRPRSRCGRKQRHPRPSPWRTTVYQDAFAGRVLGEPATNVRHVMSRRRAWHRWLAMDGENRAMGKAISGWSNLIFLLIVLSGIYLWMDADAQRIDR